MKTKQRKWHRRSLVRRRLGIESLEARVVLDGQLGAEAVDAAVEPVGFEQFESSDELQQFLVDSAVDRWKDLFGTETNRWWHYPIFYNHRLEAIDSVVRIADNADGKPNLLTAAGSFDGTNVQVSGIDEADIVKTDGEYLYIANGSRLTLVDARDPANLAIAAQIPLSNFSGELYVNGDRLMVLSHTYGVIPRISPLLATDSLIWEGPHGPRTSLAVYDIADRTAPSLLHETTVDGNLTASRRSDDFVYLVMSDQIRMPQLQFSCESTSPVINNGAGPELETLVVDSLIAPPDWPDFPHETCIYETQETYLARVEDQLLELALPSFETTDSEGEVTASGVISE